MVRSRSRTRAIPVCFVDFCSLSGARSHDGGGGALQRNFLPFIAQHIFFGIFFLLIYFFVFGFLAF